VRACLFIASFILLIVSIAVGAFAASPLSLTDVETLLKSKVNNGRIINLLKERKTSVELSTETVKKLKKLGANQAVINAIDKYILTGIQVESEPSGAEVFIDGKFRGATPLKILNIPTGKHELKIDKAEGYMDYVTEIELLPGQTWKNTVVLNKRDYPKAPPTNLPSRSKPADDRQMVSVRVRTEPVSVNIYLDDKFIGESPVEFLSLVGSHHLKLVPTLSSRYETVEKEFIVRRNELNVIFLRLNSKRD
jgi:hypothetical protein